MVFICNVSCLLLHLEERMCPRAPHTVENIAAVNKSQPSHFYYGHLHEQKKKKKKLSLQPC